MAGIADWVYADGRMRNRFTGESIPVAALPSVVHPFNAYWMANPAGLPPAGPPQPSTAEVNAQIAARRKAGPPTPAMAKRKAGPPTPQTARKAALEQQAGASTGTRSTPLVDQTGQRAPVLAALEPMTASPLDPTVGARMEVGSQPPPRVQAAAAGSPVTTVEADPLEQARLDALDQVLARWRANGGQVFQGPGSTAYTSSQTFGSNAQPGMVPGDVRLGAAAGPATTPDQANGGNGQFTADAIAAYILSAWEDPNLRSNMTPENLAFLASLR